MQINKPSGETKARVQLIAAMALFGTIGLFVRAIPLSSGLVALTRGVIGAAFLLLMTVLRGGRVSHTDVRRNLRVLLPAGACIGANWILLFEAYRYTTVATATLCYYLAPIFVILASPLLLKEKLTPKKLLCVLMALVGMAFVCGVFDGGTGGARDGVGILLGVGAAVFYAGVILLNKRQKEISAFDSTIVQLSAASATLLPYVLLTERAGIASFSPRAALLLLVVGVLHTGIAYAMYFGAMQRLKAQSAAIWSYVDPVVAILLSALLLGEPLGWGGAAGAALVLGAAFLSERAGDR